MLDRDPWGDDFTTNYNRLQCTKYKHTIPTNYIQTILPSPTATAPLSKHLPRQTIPSRVLDKDTAVDLALVDAALLEAVVDNGGGVGRLLEDADLELAAAVVGVGQECRHVLQRRVADGVVDLEGASGVGG